jgi:hypothetical protein
MGRRRKIGVNFNRNLWLLDIDFLAIDETLPAYWLALFGFTRQNCVTG